MSILSIVWGTPWWVWAIFVYIIVLGWRFLIHRPGSWVPLVFALSFFIVKYALGLTYALHPEMRFHIFFWMTDAAVSGLISGTFWGRFLHVIQCYRRNTQNNNTTLSALL